MKIFDCHHTPHDGTLKDVPTELHYYLSSFTTTEYREYNFGWCLIQRYQSKYYEIFIICLQVNKEARLKFIHEPGMALQFSLAQKGKSIDIGIPRKGYCRMADLTDLSLEVDMQPITAEWLQIHWKSEIKCQIFEDLPDPYEVFNTHSINDNTRSQLIEAPLNYISRTSINLLRNCNYKDYRQTMELKIRIITLVMEYYDWLDESKRIHKIENVINKETIIKVSDEINAEPNIHHGVKYFADKFFINRKSLQRGFLTLYNTTIPDYIEQCCMRTAQYLLHNCNKSIEEVSEQFGYSNTFNFSRAFKRHYNNRRPEEFLNR